MMINTPIPVIKYQRRGVVYYLHEVCADTEQCWWTKDPEQNIVSYHVNIKNKTGNVEYETSPDAWERYLKYIKTVLLNRDRFKKEDLKLEYYYGSLDV